MPDIVKWPPNTRQTMRNVQATIEYALKMYVCITEQIGVVPQWKIFVSNATTVILILLIFVKVNLGELYQSCLNKRVSEHLGVNRASQEGQWWQFTHTHQ